MFSETAPNGHGQAGATNQFSSARSEWSNAQLNR